MGDTKGPGVIQAAMALSEALFIRMSASAWHHALRPKVQGTLNLHHALKDHEPTLDFFALTSSVSSSVGTATESNYCAANAFLDAFANWRRGQGLKCIFIGLGMLSEVGYLHEHEEIQQLLLRKGVHPINEEEMLHLVEIALLDDQRFVQTPAYKTEDVFSRSDGHIISGLELVGLDRQRHRGFEGHSHVLDDPRAALLARNYFANEEKGGDNTAASAFNKGRPVQQTMREVVANKLSNLLLVPVQDFEDDKLLADFSLDSMLAAEFRGHVFRTLKVDVPFMIILSQTASITSLTQLIMEKLGDGQ